MLRKEVQLLQDAKELLETKGWTKYFFAKDKNGFPLEIGSKDATCYCIVGAIHSTYVMNKKSYTSEDRWSALKLLTKQLEVPDVSLPLYNDHPDTTKEDILDLISKAISTLRFQ